ncbi:hypothetical protein [Burkholderia vietnamiensis]|uniref:hypothetical protein n=1 Tax=Burkholderia vietnamiensis TaxID=60552 RepID=UPI001CB3EA66|nr:hypothetical protein [Burkholderia vietnamiensis]CAG9227426.1 conserved hypothetical protein [Burkholderia vietnamiensis]
MIQPPTVPVEGKLALPRVAPLGGVPSFGREWTFRPVSGAERRTRCVATLTTSCVDSDAPHRACRWQPLSVEPPSVAPLADRSIRTAGRTRDRRALHAACWSIGALGIIGALIATHEPFPRFAPEPAREHASVMQPYEAPAAAAVRVATIEPIAPNASVVVPAHPSAAAQPVPTSSEAARRARDAATAPAPSPLASVAAADTPPHRPNIVRTLSAPRYASATARPAAAWPITGHTSQTASLDHPHRPPHPDGLHNAADDLLTLIALADALQAELPARRATMPTTGFDWTARLSHRRLTDTPDLYTR